MAVAPQERRALLDQVNQLASSALLALWAQAGDLGNEAFAAVMIDAFPQLVDPYVEMSSTLAADWFEQSDPLSTYVAVTSPPLPVEKLTSSAEWALGARGEKGLARLEGTLQRAVFDGARDTIILNVDRTGSRWVRHARPNACEFCRMLATRHSDPDYWYSSSDSALNVVGVGRDEYITLPGGTRVATRSSGKRPRGARDVGSEGYHDDCRCIAVEVRDGQEYEPPDYVLGWEDEYRKARANAGTGDTKQILSAWRQISRQ